MGEAASGPGNILWLASYPKSGNTWMRLLLAGYFGEQDEPQDINSPGVTNGIASSRAFFDNLMCVDSADLTDQEVTPLRPHVYDAISAEARDLVWMKVHDSQQQLSDECLLFPPGASRGAVYILRNPLDVAVSIAYHAGHEDFERSSREICQHDNTIGGVQKDQLLQVLNSWSDHVASWTQQSEIPTLIVRYEDMLADTAAELRRVLTFARPDEAVDDQRIKFAVEGASFDNLQAAEQKNGFRETTARQKRFFRSGIAGDWQTKLVEKQVSRIRDANREMMAQYGYH